MSTVAPEIEMLARMWIECDPNRGGEPRFEPYHDELDPGGEPRWHWFIPRAEASLAYFARNGFALVCKEPTP